MIKKFVKSSKIIEYDTQDAIVEMLYQRSFLVSAWGKLFRNSLFYQIEFPKGKLFEDSAIMYKVFENAKKLFIRMLTTILTVAYYKQWLPKKLLRAFTIGLVLTIMYFLASYSGNSGEATASTNHIDGLLMGLSTANLAGNGLGTAGVTATALTGAETTVRESYIGVLFAQIGYVGGLAFIGFILAEGKQLLDLYRTYKSKFLILSFTCLLGVFTCSIFSESAISIMGTEIYFIIIGITEQERLYFNKNNKLKVEG